MDVSIAVSLIRGQMGNVVEQAVNGAVETVLAEMLRVVGVKFEELKGQLAQMKRDIAVLQREKALKEKENDSIRSKLRYTELKLKYYRQGVEEELQQRVSASNMVCIRPPAYAQTQRGGVSSAGTPPSCTTQNKTDEGSLTRSNQELTSLHAKRSRGHVDVVRSEASDQMLPVVLPGNICAEPVDSSTVLFSPMEQDLPQVQDQLMTMETYQEVLDPVVDMANPQTSSQDSEEQSASDSLSPDGSTSADSSTLPPAEQVKHEPQEQQIQQQQPKQEVICIKEEPEEEQEVTAALQVDCPVQQVHPPESQVPEWSEHQENLRTHAAAFSTAVTNSYAMPQPAAPLPSVASLQQPVTPSQQLDPAWNNDFTLYEDYKLRRNELRRVNQSRRRELEKMLPQPLLADLMRERREKTRLRVARWRAKRKLQAGLNQIKVEGGAAGSSQTNFPSRQQQRWLKTSSPGDPQRRSVRLPPPNRGINVSLPFGPSSSSSSSSSLHQSGSGVTPFQHAVTSSSSSYPQVGFSEADLSLIDADIIQCRV